MHRAMSEFEQSGKHMLGLTSSQFDPTSDMPLKATRPARQCEERGRHARGQIDKDAEDRTMIPIDAGQTLNQLQPTSVLLSFLLQRLLTAPAGS
jgi:hypothetical protein